MHIVYSLIEQFPPLAWVAHCRWGEEPISVRHGRFVEVATNYFAEGAWSGDFAAGRIQDSDTVFGSGGALEGDAAIFASCTATTDFLYHNNDPKNFVIANSLPLLLAVLNDALKPDCTDYADINASILKGIDRYRAELPTLNGTVWRVTHRNISWDKHGITLVDKPMPPAFGCYKEYRDFLGNRIEALFTNARDINRRHPMRVYSTQSRGYDSTAINSLAAPYGIDKVFTSTTSKEPRSFYLKGSSDLPNDDGTEICNSLGLPCIPIDRLAFTRTLPDEHYYWAGRDNNQDLNLHAIHAQTPESPFLLLTGFIGDVVFRGKNGGPAFMDLRRTDQSGLGLSEFRLLRGFINTAVLYIGALRAPDLTHIAKENDMAPWRLNSHYDRPIPRRIAEEAGVPRELFGQVKLASIVHLPTPNLPVTPELKLAFFKHLRAHRLIGLIAIALLPVVQRINNFIYWKNPTKYFHSRNRYPLLWRLGYYWSRVFGRPPTFRMLWGRIDSILYAFCVNKVKDEYSAHMISSKP